MSADLQQLVVNPIGRIFTGERAKFSTPFQPQTIGLEEASSEVGGIIKLLPNCNYEVGLRDLEGFDYIWLLWWFSRHTSWRPTVLPPRGDGRRKGVFATRAPYRPNPIGISVVRLINILPNGQIIVGRNDLLDKTPILDIKPYIPEVDSIPEAKSGWIDSIAVELAREPTFEISLSDLAMEQLLWLEQQGVHFFEQAREILVRSPAADRRHRITSLPNGEYRMGCGGWRIYFFVDQEVVRVSKFGVGYSFSNLQRAVSDLPDRDVMISFLSRWCS